MRTSVRLEQIAPNGVGLLGGRKMKKNKQIFELWKLLDDIDTASDMFKDNYKSLTKYIFKIQQKRHSIVSNKKINKLYDKYYK